MDRAMKAEIVATVKSAMSEAFEMYNEKYITAKELTAQFSMITADWLKKNGERLPRVKVPDSNRVAYPLHKIARMVADGSINSI